HPWVCAHVFRFLPTLSQHIVMNCFYASGLPNGVPIAVVKDWVAPGKVKDIKYPLEMLIKLRIASIKGQHLRFSAVYMSGLSISLFQGGASRADPPTERAVLVTPLPLETKRVGAKKREAVGKAAKERWDGLFTYLLQPENTVTDPSVYAPVPVAAKARGTQGRARRGSRAAIKQEAEAAYDPALGMARQAAQDRERERAASRGREGARDATPVDPQICELAHKLGLVQRVSGSKGLRGNHPLRLSPSGYAFVLGDASSQVWAVALALIDMAAKGQLHNQPRPLPRSDVVALLLLLLSVPSLASIKASSIALRFEPVIEAMKTPGLVRLMFRPVPNTVVPYANKIIVPTHVLESLSNADARDTLPGTSAFVVVESTFRVYAHADRNEPLITVLGLFADKTMVLPGTTVLEITHESCNRAFAKGVTASDIARCLHSYSHPATRKSRFPVPSSVLRQLEVWFHQVNRLRSCSACVVEGFKRVRDFQRVVQSAKDAGSLLWASKLSKGVIEASALMSNPTLTMSDTDKAAHQSKVASWLHSRPAVVIRQNAKAAVLSAAGVRL
ncbi:transcription factor TFIIH subunit p52/Tfb2, partial [Kipferlia bialata]